MRSLLVFAFLTVPYSLGAAALVPLAGPKQPAWLSEIQPNRGQAAPAILFQTRGTVAIAAQGSSLLINPIGVRQNFLASNPNPQVGFFDPLPGLANDYSTANREHWITSIPRYATARLAAIYPGIDAEYALDSNGTITLRLSLAPNANLNQVVFELPDAVILAVNATAKTVTAQFLQRGLGPIISYGPAVSSTFVTFEQLSATTFRLTTPNRDSSVPLRIDVPLFNEFSPTIHFTSDRLSNLWAAVRVPDPAGRPAPLPNRSGCGSNVGSAQWAPRDCTDVAVYKLSPDGVMLSVTYISGNATESPTFLGIAVDGSIVVTGNTNSSDFPVSPGALQSAYAGPAGVESFVGGGDDVSGDYFALRLDPATGALRSSTYLGGPNPDRIGETVLASDGSLYFLHKSFNFDTTELPTSSGALMRECTDTSSGTPPNVCLNGYVAHLSANLDRLLFGTYVPGSAGPTMRLHSDGSIYYSGDNSASFQPTPGAYQTSLNGVADGIVARLDPTGSRLLFATYLGGPKSDSVRSNAVAPDGSVWVQTESWDQCCSGAEPQLIRLDSTGAKRLVDVPIGVDDIATDRDGNVLAITSAPFTPSSGALLSHACPSYGLGYVRLSATGQPLFFTYLPRTSRYEFYGTGPHGLPILDLDVVLQGSTRYEILEDQDMGVFIGCMVDSANYINGDALSPGEIVTIFGSQMGPEKGAAFSLENGLLPTALGGTQVIVNSRPIPLLYVSASQINAVLPFDLEPNGPFDVQVLNLQSGNAISNHLAATGIGVASLSLYTLDSSGQGQVAAINEDGTINSPQHPAKPGSRVALFGTGGGQTAPASTAGEVTPLEIRMLLNPSGIKAGSIPLSVEFAGAAPGLVSGANQINIKLPDPMPKIEDYPSGTLPLCPFSSNASYYPGCVTLSVLGN